MPLVTAAATASYRQNSEDRLAVHLVDGGVVVVVADGVGGVAGGGAAADLAMTATADAVRASFDLFSAKTWVDLLTHADAVAVADRCAGETTAVVVAVSNDGRVVGASCGDSGAVLVAPNGGIDDLTSRQHKKRRVGSGRALPVVFERALSDGTLVIATDGLFAFARPDEIRHAVARHEDLDALTAALVGTVRLANGSFQDDVATVLIRRCL